MQFILWNKKTEVEDLSGIDIGLMPLPDTEWAKGKCGFKILEYFSMGIPAVASPVGVNRNIIQHGKNGFLCTDSQEWMENLNLLLQSKELREQLGKAGRRLVTKIYSPEVNSTNFLGLFE
jgi:glycosyltransferase involved in cell wall biosynthesis